MGNTGHGVEKNRRDVEAGGRGARYRGTEARKGAEAAFPIVKQSAGRGGKELSSPDRGNRLLHQLPTLFVQASTPSRLFSLHHPTTQSARSNQSLPLSFNHSAGTTLHPTMSEAAPARRNWRILWQHAVCSSHSYPPLQIESPPSVPSLQSPAISCDCQAGGSPIRRNPERGKRNTMSWKESLLAEVGRGSCALTRRWRV